ncbi:hypothetical protein [Stenotrophobium rhamnosiphilum]|uniref:hypothetical protein n=1 Tax=Stenotrophobium rhamnosiphilum TaxID=2029166 RepID=UPI001374BA65|nr:hypothetical protein [Stenotrophobium rhamnosiphilum]
MLEALLFAAAVSTAAANQQAKPPAAPSPELLEFIADWTEPEARQILDTQHAKAPLPSLGQTTAPTKNRELRYAR